MSSYSTVNEISMISDFIVDFEVLSDSSESPGKRAFALDRSQGVLANANNHQYAQMNLIHEL
jgi:hypothetical protein